MRKVIQIVSIGIAAYNLYVLVDDFLKTPTGQKVKGKVQPYVEDAVEQAKDLASKVMDKVEKEAPIVAEEAVDAVDSELKAV